MSSALPLFAPDAVWIGSPHPFDLHEAYLDFLSPILDLARVPAQACLYITADSRYRLWVNGQAVARGPARCYPWCQQVDRLDITAWLLPGANRLAVQVYQPGYSHFAYVHRGAAGLLAHCVCDGASVLYTDAAWRVRRNPSFAAVVPRVSIYGSGVEQRTLARDDAWSDPGYDTDGWSASRVVAPLGGYPWTDLRLRELPQLLERKLPLRLVEMRVGASPAAFGSDAHAGVRAGWEAGAAHAFPADGAGWFRPKLEVGESACWLYDLERDYACQGWAEIANASGQEYLSVSYAEKMRGGRLVLSDPETYCRVRLTDRFNLRAGNQIAESFSLRGGRYLLFMLCGPSDPHLRIRLHARAFEYPLEITKPALISDPRPSPPVPRPSPKLEATKPSIVSDPELAAIARLCEQTLHACLQDGFVDSTWRESSQWVGDALPQALTLASMSDDLRPLRQVIEMAADGAYADGVLPGVTPGEVHAYTIVDYNFMWVELLHLYRRLAGDDALVRKLWPALIKMLDRFDQDVAGDGLLRSQTGRRLFLDWAPVSRREPSAIYNLHYLLALQTAGELAEALGERAVAVFWTVRAGNIQPAVRAAFWHAGRWYDDRQRTTFSQLAAALAILTGAALPSEQDGLLEAIAARSLDPDDGATPGRMVLASPFMHHYLFEALSRGGRPEAVIEIIRQRWGRWVRAGYPTTWENWNVDFPDGSQCHAFSAHPRYHLIMCGVQ